jgi:sortase A
LKDHLVNHHRSWLRVVQIVAIIFGVILLGWYLVARGHSFFASRAAIERFEEMRPQITVNRHRSAAAIPSSKPVDTTLWAVGRTEEFQQSLFADVDAPLALMRIPRLEIEVPVFAGTSDLILNRGVGQIEGTAMPGERGNIGIAGHRDGFFRPLKDIALGDEIVLETPTKRTTFIVEDLHIVDPSDVWVLAPTDAPAVTLVTCYPFYFVGSAPQRFIVRATASARAGP